ncbi:RNA polymerase sigma factor RpoE [Opitutales bacterium ASA1]|uniref:RNA polymerase sigma factor n=1 Tax=Congregicoccus parvus TaxID=3081749 RepID=UPI002B2FB6A3|nr:RNA polymerase sigma factor RpoE [Opitutales bacterium ASA1]
MNSDDRSRPPTSPSEDPRIVRAQSGDQEAFGELMREHYDYVFRLVHAIVRREHDARDVCQEVWVSAWKKLPTFRGRAKFTTWLHPIAVRRAIDAVRKQRRWFDRFLPFLERSDGERAQERDIGVLFEPVAAEPDPAAEAERDDRRERFERALAALPPKHRAVLALREVEGLSYDEIARAVNCRPGTVMSRLFHARRMLVRQLGDHS